MEMVVGMDVGTTGLKLSPCDRTGKPVEFCYAGGGNSLLSIVYIDPQSGRALFGDAAYEQSFVDPLNSARHFKTKIGSDEKLLAGKTAVELTAMQLAEAKRRFEEQTGETIDKVVLTRPVSYTDLQDKCLLKAAELAGIRVQRLIDEPSAAAYAYVDLKSTNKRGEIILLYDFGGGTFDMALLQVDGNDVKVLATDGVQKLGGDDIDAILEQIVLKKIEGVTGKPTATLLNDPLFRLDLAGRCTKAKISLGARDSVQIPLSVSGQPIVILVSRNEFETAIEPLIAKSLECCDRAIKAAGLSKSDLSSLFMSGGTSLMPYVQQRASDHLGLVPRYEINPATVVAQGAALVGQSELKQEGKQSRMGTDVIPQPHALLALVTHHDVGIAVEDRTDGNKRILNAVVVPKNSPISEVKSQLFRLESPDQRDVIIEVLQGPDRADFKDCLVIGRLELKNLPVERARSPRIKVTFEFDKNGCVNVTARDMISGQETTATVNVPK